MFQNEWTPFLKEEFQKPYFQQLSAFLRRQYATTKVYPPRLQVFSAFEFTNYSNVKVVILGQDPYHQPNQAHGMCFSVRKGVKVPPSLVNIYKELHDDLGCTIPHHGYLMKWAQQGVFLMNTVLTVEDSKPLSHRGMGRIHRRGYAQAERPSRSAGLYPVGPQRSGQGPLDHQSQAFNPEIAASFAAVGQLRLFRYPSVLQGQSISDRSGSRAD